MEVDYPIAEFKNINRSFLFFSLSISSLSCFTLSLIYSRPKNKYVVSK
jgi:hypothetical protein